MAKSCARILNIYRQYSHLHDYCIHADGIHPGFRFRAPQRKPSGKDEHRAAEYSYTLYIKGTGTKTARYQEKIKVGYNRYTYVSREKEYTVPSDAIDGTGTIRLLSSPTTRRNNIRIEFTGRLDGTLCSE